MWARHTVRLSSYIGPLWSTAYCITVPIPISGSPRLRHAPLIHTRLHARPKMAIWGKRQEGPPGQSSRDSRTEVRHVASTLPYVSVARCSLHLELQASDDIFLSHCTLYILSHTSPTPQTRRNGTAVSIRLHSSSPHFGRAAHPRPSSWCASLIVRIEGRLGLSARSELEWSFVGRRIWLWQQCCAKYRGGVGCKAEGRGAREAVCELCGYGESRWRR